MLSKVGNPFHRLGRVEMKTRQVGLVRRIYVPSQRALSPPISCIDCITYDKSGTFFLARKLSSSSSYQCSQRASVFLLRSCACSLSSFSQQQIPHATKSMASPRTVIVVTSCSFYTMVGQDTWLMKENNTSLYAEWSLPLGSILELEKFENMCRDLCYKVSQSS